MKSEVKSLEKRLERIMQEPKTETAEWKTHAESVAYYAWIFKHLTETERHELCDRIVAAEKAASTKIDDEMRRILMKGEQRAALEQPNVWEEFKQKCMRAEALRNTLRPLNEAERDELDALNAWLRVHATDRRRDQEPR